MTREEAAYKLKAAFTMCEFKDAYGEPIDSDIYYDAMNMAIQALEAQDGGTTEDADDIYAIIYVIMKNYYFEHKDEHDASWQNGFGKCMNLIPNVFEKKTPLEPCEDCISRAMAIKTLQSDLLWAGSIVEAVREDSIDLMKKLPPVTPKLSKDALDDAFAHGYTEAEAKFYRWREEHECEDAVSRAAVMDILYLDPGITVEQEKMIKQLPSVMPKPKIGKWNFIGYQMFECSCCRKPYTEQQLENLKVYKDDPELPNFCPNCGSYNGSDKNSDK